MDNLNNHEIAKLLRNVAAAYSIIDDKKYIFQIIAYQKAADIIDNLNIELKDIYGDGKEIKIQGIGESMKDHLRELFKTGEVTHFNTILSKVPSSVFPLLDVPSFGAKKAYKLVSAFKLKNPGTVIEDIKKLAEEGKIASVPTFGEKSEKDIIRAIEEYKQGKTKSNRMPLPYATEIGNKVLGYLKISPYIKEANTLGSLRRKVSTVGDIDIAVSSKNPKKAIEHFINYPGKERLIEKGDRTSSILVSGGKQVDLMVQEPESYGSLLQHFTGSKHHNVALREYALKKGLSLSEYGIKVKEKDKIVTKKFSNEEDFYKYIGLEFVPPELRENQGEIELAIRHKLPELVELKDIKGDLHIHSSYPIEPSHDLGKNSMQEIIDKAVSLGYEYIGFSEHNPSITNHSKEQIYQILSKRKDKIEQLKKSNKSIQIINLLEVDILANGELSLDNKSLEFLDAIIVGIHSSHNMNKEQMTKRVISGLSHQKAKILAHPSARLINQRPEIDMDWDKLFEYIIKENKALEINAWPNRLDLTDSLVKKANDTGARFVINTDSHAKDQMENMFYGVAVARRGWCTKQDILNTLPYREFISWLTS